MKKLSGSRIANLIVIAAVLIVPLLYAGLLTLAYQNPTNLLGHINAAVVNEDTAYTTTLASGSSKTLALGDELTRTLVHPDTNTDTGFTWHDMSAQEAEKKMRNEEIRAILYIPEGFSKKAAQIGSEDPSTARTQTLQLVTDDGVNYLTGTMARTVAETLANRLENEGSQKILSTMLLSISTIRDNITHAADGAQSLTEGSKKLEEGTDAATSGAQELTTGARTLALGLDQLANGSVSLSTGLIALDHGTTRAQAGAAALAQGLDTLKEGHENAEKGSTQLSQGARALDLGAATLQHSTTPFAEGVTSLSIGSTSLKDGILSYTRGVDQISAGTSLLREKISDPTTGLPAGIATLSAGIGHATDTASPNSAPTSLYGGINALTAGTKALADSMTTPQAGSDVNLHEGADRVAEGLQQLTTAAHSVNPEQITAGVAAASKLSDSIEKYTALVDQLAQTCIDEQDTSENCQALRSLSTRSQELRSGSQELSHTLTHTSANIVPLSQLSTQLSALHEGAQKVSEGVAAASSGAQKINAAAAALHNAMPALRSGVDQLQRKVGSVDSSDQTSLMGALGALDDGLRTITAPTHNNDHTVYTHSEQIRAASTKIAEGSASMNAKMPSLNTGISSLSQGAHSLFEGASSLKSGMNRLLTGSTEASLASHTLNDGLTRLKDGAAAAHSGAHTLSQGLTRAQSGATRLSEGAATLAQGNTALNNGAQRLFEGASTLANGLNEGVKKIPNYSDAQRDAITTVGAQAASVEAVRDHAVANNGAGFTPMFMSLALWIGAIALFLILPALDKRDHGEKWWASAVRPATTATLLAAAQAVIMMIAVNTAAGIEAKNLMGLCLMAVAAAVTFMLINQACVALLAFRGRFISIILLSLQITSMGATFPVETAPSFFQWIHPFLPMSYTQLAFRQLIAGSGAQGAIGNALVVLGIWAGLAILGILIGARIRRGPHPLPADNALAPTAA